MQETGLKKCIFLLNRSNHRNVDFLAFPLPYGDCSLTEGHCSPSTQRNPTFVDKIPSLVVKIIRLTRMLDLHRNFRM